MIRNYRSSDHDALCDLWDAVFPNPSAHNKPEKIISEKVAVQPDMLFVALTEDTIVGSIIAGYDGHRGWLNLVAVHPGSRNQGIGKQLVRHALGALNQMGCKKVNIQIREGNEHVIHFYQKLGFSTEPRVSMGRFIND